LTRGGRNSRSARASRGIGEVQARRGRRSNRTAPKQFPTAFAYASGESILNRSSASR